MIGRIATNHEGMKPVSDAFLLQFAGIAASLLGFFVVGVFFYVQRGMFPRAAQVAQQYMQAAARTVIVLYGMTLGVSLGLAVLESSWAALLYLSLSFVLLWSVIRTSVAIERLHRALEIRVMPQIPMWLAAVASLAGPWVLGGIDPSREQLTAAILFLGVLAFASSASLVLSTFDISRLESSAVPASQSEVLTGGGDENEGLDGKDGSDSRSEAVGRWKVPGRK